MSHIAVGVFICYLCGQKHRTEEIDQHSDQSFANQYHMAGTEHKNCFFLFMLFFLYQNSFVFIHPQPVENYSESRSDCMFVRLILNGL